MAYFFKNIKLQHLLFLIHFLDMKKLILNINVILMKHKIFYD